MKVIAPSPGERPCREMHTPLCEAPEQRVRKKVVTTTYSYAGTGGANPDAVTKITSGASGTTYAYDLNGNLTSAGNGSSLSYLNARYMDPSRGQFLSQEQIYLALGDRDRVQQLAQRDQQAYLSDPQRLNMYSYAKDNPIGNKDTSGLISEGEIEAVYKLLYANSGRETVNGGIDAFFGSPGQTPQEQASAQAQFRYDAGTFSVTTAAIYGLNLTGTGAVIDIGNVVLGGVDKYCSGHVCKNLSQSQNVTSAQILAGIPTGPKADYTLSNRPANGSPAGGPVWGQNPGASQASGNTKSGGGGGGNSSPSLIGIYQSVVALLTAYVSALSAPATSSH
jgi:hypothetical protein